jgi:hypothetical protein
LSQRNSPGTSLILELLGLAGSVASLIGLYWTTRPPNYEYGLKDGLLLFVSVGLAFAVATMRLRDYMTGRPITLRSDREIRDYMYRWLSRGTRVMIFSHDLTWVNDEEMRDLLRGKARRGELSVCLKECIPFSNEVSSLGAKVFTYGELNYTPASRFTIINHGRYDAHVAIGRGRKGEHIVREIASGQDPLFALANDLTEIVMRLNNRASTT